MDPSELQQERRRLARDLPALEEVLRACLFERSVRCGKPNCRCADPDDPGHAVVCVSRSLPEGKTSQISLPRQLVPVAEVWIQNSRRWLEAIEQISAINHELLRRRWVEPPPTEGSRRR
ncbi:MAG: hypothetical protein GEU90_18705 [Gemmatimonas sp.]|nr:hypothetical protein [Gemmatimonas sp.]